MPDWTLFHAATTANTRPVVLASACARAWRWLDLAPAEQEAAVTDAVRTGGDARTTAEALWLVWARLWREAGVDAGDAARFQAALDDLAAGRASEAVVVAARRTGSAVTMRQLVLARYPGAAQDADDGDRALLNAATPAVSAAVEGVGLGVVTPASLAVLEDAIAAFEPLAREMQPGTRRDHAWWMGLAWWAMGRGAQELARHAEAHTAFERAAAFYDDAGEAATAAACRQLARDLDLRLSADLDAAATPIVHALLANQESDAASRGADAPLGGGRSRRRPVRGRGARRAGSHAARRARLPRPRAVVRRWHSSNGLSRRPPHCTAPSSSRGCAK